MNKIMETILYAGFGMSVSLLIGVVAYVAVYAIFKSLAKNGVIKNLKSMTVFLQLLYCCELFNLPDRVFLGLFWARI